MELSYSDLRKREVINMVDGRSLGKVCDLSLDFPDGVLTGIFVPGKRNRGIFHIFDRTKIFIPESNIVKIGGDVILVDLKCGEFCAPSTKRRPVPPPCPPQQQGVNGKCPKPPIPPSGSPKNANSGFEIFGNVETEDY